MSGIIQLVTCEQRKVYLVVYLESALVTTFTAEWNTSVCAEFGNL